MSKEGFECPRVSRLLFVTCVSKLSAYIGAYIRYIGAYLLYLQKMQAVATALKQAAPYLTLLYLKAWHHHPSRTITGVQ